MAFESLAKGVEGTALAVITTGVGSWVGAEIGQAIQLNPHLILPSEYISIFNNGSQAIVPTVLALGIGSIVGLFASEWPIAWNNNRIDRKEEPREYQARRQMRQDIEGKYGRNLHADNVMRQLSGLDPVEPKRRRPSRPRS